MRKVTRYRLAAAAILALALEAPAWAVTTTRVIVNRDQQEVPEGRIQLFNADTGAEAPRQDDDQAGVLYLLDGGRYRVVVDGETVREISVTGSGSETFTIDLPPIEPAPPPDGVPDGISALMDGGIGETEIPVTGIGFRRAGAPGVAPETFAGETPATINIVHVDGSLQVPIGRISPIFSFSYAEGDGRGDFAVPAGGAGASGIVYGDNAPSGSSGIATGLGLSGTMESEVVTVTAAVEVPVLSSDFGSLQIEQLPLPRSNFTALLTITPAVTTRNYSGNAAASGGGLSFSQTRDQEIDEIRIAVGVGGRFFLPLSDDVTARLGADGMIYYRDTDLTSTERNLCNFCPASDRDFTLNIEDSDNGWGFRGRGSAEIEFRLSRRFGLTVGGEVEYLSSVGGVFNPNSGDQVFFDGRRTGLLTDSVWSWRVGAGARITFGGR